MLSPQAKNTLKVVVVVVAVVALVSAWVFTPLRTLATPGELQKLIAPVTESPWLPGYMLIAFVVAGALFLSVWLVIFQTSLLFPPIAAFPLAMAGALLSALLFYGLGRLLGADVVTRMAPQRVQVAVRGAGLESIIAVRVLPILPFTFVNLCCGAFGVRPAVFVGGTVIGMAPGILGMSLLGERLLAAMKDPTPESVGVVVVVAALLIGTATLLRRRANRVELRPAAPSDPSPPVS
ncbi:MAG: VTT domain-containing protein [Deltaproteobacteria bacterium]|nr:VTT domain-containing protein [Deltaproteobacteria bacterium]